jgi:hypothetical protein
MQQIFRAKSVFDELELVMQITTSSKYHIDKNQETSKKHDESMQGFKLFPNDTIKLLTRKPSS